MRETRPSATLQQLLPTPLAAGLPSHHSSPWMTGCHPCFPGEVLCTFLMSDRSPCGRLSAVSSGRESDLGCQHASGLAFADARAGKEPEKWAPNRHIRMPSPYSTQSGNGTIHTASCDAGDYLWRLAVCVPSPRLASDNSTFQKPRCKLEKENRRG